MELPIKARMILLVTLFCATIAMPLPHSEYLERQKAPLPGRAPFRKPGDVTREDYYTGKAGPKFEQGLQNASYFGRWATAHHNELVFRATGRTPPGAWLGQDDWLFVPKTVREFRPDHWDKLVEENAATIALVDQRVRQKGIRLVVALIPDRARVYPDKAYRRGEMPPGKARFLPALAERLRAQDIIVVELTDALTRLRATDKAPFYPDDHHWTSAGAEAAMQELARALPEEQQAIMQRHRAAPMCRGRTNVAAPSESSLVKRLGFRPGGALERRFYHPEPRTAFGKCSAEGWQGTCATYWGTSYSEWGSPQFFALAAGCPVRMIYKAGTGSSWAPSTDLPRLALAPELDGDHFVVWSIPEYHLVGDYGEPTEGDLEKLKKLAPR